MNRLDFRQEAFFRMNADENMYLILILNADVDDTIALFMQCMYLLNELNRTTPLHYKSQLVCDCN